jgi:hypothetical protein
MEGNWEKYVNEMYRTYNCENICIRGKWGKIIIYENIFPMRQVKLNPDHTSTNPRSVWWLHNSVPRHALCNSTRLTWYGGTCTYLFNGKAALTNNFF